MNERIRELQIQAFADCKTFEDNKVRTDEVFEKFAELIVRECIEVVKWTPSEFLNDEYVKNIKEHFGVEE